MNERVARSVARVAKGHRPTILARAAGFPAVGLAADLASACRCRPGRGRPGDGNIVEIAKANPTDGTRMVAALASRQLAEPVNRKRAQPAMRERRPEFFRVTRPDEFWHLDLTKAWTAEHGWISLHAAIDCCTREITDWRLDVRTRSQESIGCVEAGAAPRRPTRAADRGLG